MLVVGAGNSAAEIAIDLARAGALPGLYFVGVTVQLAGLLREIGLEAQAVGRAIGAQAMSG